MKHTIKLLITGWANSFFENENAHYRMYKLTSFALLQCVMWAITTIASTTSDSADTIAEALLAAEAQFSNLQLQYTATRRNWNSPNQPFSTLEGVYHQKSIITGEGRKRLRYLDRKVFFVDPNTRQTTLVDDTLSTFDGNATMVLDRKVESGKPMRGYVLAGYDRKQFPSYYMDPHAKIWYFDGQPLGEILKQNRDTFRTVSKSEMLDGIPTVRLMGTIWHGKAAMTLWVSPERGFIPIKTQFTKASGERLLMGTILHDLVRLPSGAWYAKKIQSPEVPLSDPAPAYFLIYDISKISTDTVSEDSFRLKFPPNTLVFDDILKVSYTTTD